MVIVRTNTANPQHPTLTIIPQQLTINSMPFSNLKFQIPALPAGRSNLKLKSGFTLVELLVARHPKPWRRKAIHGFTLIELLVVIAIIAVLATIAGASYSQAQIKSLDGKRKADLKGIQQSLEQYYQANNKYPDTDTGKIKCNTTTPSVDTNTINWGGIFQCANLIYMNPLPKDPAFASDPNANYYYTPIGATNQQYEIMAAIENKNDPENKDNTSYVPGTLPCTNSPYTLPTSPRTYCVINP